MTISDLNRYINNIKSIWFTRANTDEYVTCKITFTTLARSIEVNYDPVVNIEISNEDIVIKESSINHGVIRYTVINLNSIIAIDATFEEGVTTDDGYSY